MADFSIHIKNKYGIETFQSVKETYEWIVVSLSKLDLPEKRFNAEFNFSIGEMHCTTVGIDEFIQHAYGVSNFTFYELKISVDFEEDTDIHIFICTTMLPNDELYLNANDKVVLQRLVDIFNQTEINNQPNTATHQITINGGNNAIASNNSTATVVNESKKVEVNSTNTYNASETVKESKAKRIIKAILTNIASNIIWYILCALIGALVAYFIAKQ